MTFLTASLLSISLLGTGEEPTRRFSLVYTVNNFGNTEPVGCPHKILHDGGLPRRMTLLRQLAAADRPTLVLDGGSALFPEMDKPRDDEKEKLFPRAEYIVENMNRMGYRAMGVGTQDMLLGIGELIHLAKSAKFPFLSANFEIPTEKGQEPPFKPSIIQEIGGVRVGVIGLLNEFMGRHYVLKVAPGSVISPAIPAAKKEVEALRGKVDLIVVISHCRMDINKDMAKEVPGIDIIIDPSIEYGNHHPHIKDEEWMEEVGSTVILRADGNGSALGVAEIDFRGAGKGMASRDALEALRKLESEGTIDEAGKARIKELQGRNHYHLRRLPIAPHYADEPEAVAILEAHKNGGDLAAVPSEPAPSRKSEYLGAKACKDCHKKQYDYWTTTTHFKALASIKATATDQLPECLSCHVTGYGQAFVSPKEAETFAGIQCEACHGTSPEHAKDPKSHHFISIAESTCLPCHNEDVVKGHNFSYVPGLKRVGCPGGELIGPRTGEAETMK